MIEEEDDDSISLSPLEFNPVNFSYVDVSTEKKTENNFSIAVSRKREYALAFKRTVLDEVKNYRKISADRSDSGAERTLNGFTESCVSDSTRLPETEIVCSIEAGLSNDHSMESMVNEEALGISFPVNSSIAVVVPVGTHTESSKAEPESLSVSLTGQSSSTHLLPIDLSASPVGATSTTRVDAPVLPVSVSDSVNIITTDLRSPSPSQRLEIELMIVGEMEHGGLSVNNQISPVDSALDASDLPRSPDIGRTAGPTRSALKQDPPTIQLTAVNTIVAPISVALSPPPSRPVSASSAADVSTLSVGTVASTHNSPPVFRPAAQPQGMGKEKVRGIIPASAAPRAVTPQSNHWSKLGDPELSDVAGTRHSVPNRSQSVGDDRGGPSLSQGTISHNHGLLLPRTPSIPSLHSQQHWSDTRDGESRSSGANLVQSANDSASCVPASLASLYKQSYNAASAPAANGSGPPLIPGLAVPNSSFANGGAPAGMAGAAVQMASSLGATNMSMSLGSLLQAGGQTSLGMPLSNVRGGSSSNPPGGLVPMPLPMSSLARLAGMQSLTSTSTAGTAEAVANAMQAVDLAAAGMGQIGLPRVAQPTLRTPSSGGTSASTSTTGTATQAQAQSQATRTLSASSLTPNGMHTSTAVAANNVDTAGTGTGTSKTVTGVTAVSKTARTQSKNSAPGKYSKVPVQQKVMTKDRDDSIASLTRRREQAQSRLSMQEKKSSLSRKGCAPLLPHTTSHWDHLLSESQFLSIDYRQERRWKLAQAKTIAHLCMERLPDFVKRNNAKRGILKSDSDVEQEGQLLGRAAASRLSHLVNEHRLSVAVEQCLSEPVPLVDSAEQMSVDESAETAQGGSKPTYASANTKGDIVSSIVKDALGCWAEEVNVALDSLILTPTGSSANETVEESALLPVQRRPFRLLLSLTSPPDTSRVKEFGAIVRGGSSSGKTVVGCTLVSSWLRRADSLSSATSDRRRVLVVVPTVSLYRWLFELRRALPHRVVGSMQSLTETVAEEAMTADVFLCPLEILSSEGLGGTGGRAVKALATAEWYGLLLDVRGLGKDSVDGEFLPDTPIIENGNSCGWLSRLSAVVSPNVSKRCVVSDGITADADGVARLINFLIPSYVQKLSTSLSAATIGDTPGFNAGDALAVWCAEAATPSSQHLSQVSSSQHLISRLSVLLSALPGTSAAPYTEEILRVPMNDLQTRAYVSVAVAISAQSALAGDDAPLAGMAVALLRRACFCDRMALPYMWNTDDREKSARLVPSSSPPGLSSHPSSSNLAASEVAAASLGRSGSTSDLCSLSAAAAPSSSPSTSAAPVASKFAGGWSRARLLQSPHLWLSESPWHPENPVPSSGKLHALSNILKRESRRTCHRVLVVVHTVTEQLLTLRFLESENKADTTILFAGSLKSSQSSGFRETARDREPSSPSHVSKAEDESVRDWIEAQRAVYKFNSSHAGAKTFILIVRDSMLESVDRSLSSSRAFSGLRPSAAETVVMLSHSWTRVGVTEDGFRLDNICSALGAMAVAGRSPVALVRVVSSGTLEELLVDRAGATGGAALASLQGHTQSPCKGTFSKDGVEVEVDIPSVDCLPLLRSAPKFDTVFGSGSDGGAAVGIEGKVSGLGLGKGKGNSLGRLPSERKEHNITSVQKLTLQWYSAVRHADESAEEALSKCIGNCVQLRREQAPLPPSGSSASDETKTEVKVEIKSETKTGDQDAPVSTSSDVPASPKFSLPELRALLKSLKLEQSDSGAVRCYLDCQSGDDGVDRLASHTSVADVVSARSRKSLTTRRLGLGVTASERRFWSLIEPLLLATNTGIVAAPVEAESQTASSEISPESSPQPLVSVQHEKAVAQRFSVQRLFRAALRVTRQRGEGIDSHLYVSPLLSASPSDLAPQSSAFSDAAFLTVTYQPRASGLLSKSQRNQTSRSRSTATAAAASNTTSTTNTPTPKVDSRKRERPIEAPPQSVAVVQPLGSAAFKKVHFDAPPLRAHSSVTPYAPLPFIFDVAPRPENAKDSESGPERWTEPEDALVLSAHDDFRHQRISWRVIEQLLRMQRSRNGAVVWRGRCRSALQCEDRQRALQSASGSDLYCDSLSTTRARVSAVFVGRSVECSNDVHKRQGSTWQVWRHGAARYQPTLSPGEDGSLQRMTRALALASDSKTSPPPATYDDVVVPVHPSHQAAVQAASANAFLSPAQISEKHISQPQASTVVSNRVESNHFFPESAPRA